MLFFDLVFLEKKGHWKKATQTIGFKQFLFLVFLGAKRNILLMYSRNQTLINDIKLNK